MNGGAGGFGIVIVRYPSYDTNTKIEGTSSLKLTFGASQPDSSTVALWHLEETGGSDGYIKDSSGNGKDLTPSGTTNTSGIYGKARQFADGTNELSRVWGGSTALVNSVEFWIYPTSFTALNILDLNGTTTITANSSGVLTSGMTSPTYYVNGVSGTQLILNTWNQVTITSATAVSIASGNTFKIGRTGANNAITGKIDEVKLSGLVRSYEEVTESYRAGRDHVLSRTIPTTNLSTKTKFPFWIASDKAGTFMESMVGESA
jgi:hypothetical protein